MIPLTYHSLALVSSNIHPSREIDLWGCNIMIHTVTKSGSNHIVNGSTNEDDSNGDFV